MLTGLVLAVPELDAVVGQHRHPGDESGDLGIPAHVTALYPWLPGPVLDAELDRLAEVLAGVPPLTLTFRAVATFPGVVYLVPEPGDLVRALTRRLVAADPQCPPYGGEHPDPEPHLTVTTLPEDETEQWAARVDVPPTTLTAGAVTVLEQQTDRRWRRVRDLPLSRPSR